MVDKNPYSSPTAIPAAAEYQPVHIGSVFGNAWRMFIENIALILGITAIIWLPISMFTCYLDYNYFYEADNIMLSFRLAQFLENMIGIIGSAAVIWIGVAANERKNVSLGGALVEGIKAWPRIWVARFIAGLAILAGLILLIIPGIYIAVRLSLAECISVAENVYGPTAIKRSYELTQGRFWYLFCLGIIVGVMIGVPAILLTIPSLFLPALDNWFYSAFVEVVASVFAAYGLLCFYCAYLEISDEYDQQLPERHADRQGA